MFWKEACNIHVGRSIRIEELARKTRSLLWSQGFAPKNTLFATATCRDEVNQVAIDLFKRDWGEQFNFCSLAGVPSAGLSGFRACSKHVPDGGNLFIMHGPHIAIDDEGVVGHLQRRGMDQATTCCGALAGAIQKWQQAPDSAPVFSEFDTEFYLVERILQASRAEILAHETPLVKATEVMYAITERLLDRIIEQTGFEMPIVMLGGILINTPWEKTDRFAVRRAIIRNYRGEKGAVWDCQGRIIS